MDKHKVPCSGWLIIWSTVSSTQSTAAFVTPGFEVVGQPAGTRSWSSNPREKIGLGWVFDQVFEKLLGAFAVFRSWK